MAQLINIADIHEDYIECGSGGGITGIEKTYYFFPSGDIYSKPFLKDSIEHFGTISRNEFERLSSFSTLLELDNYDYQNPGNSYSFLKFAQDSSSQRIVWSSGDAEIKAACKDMHKLMMQYIERINRTQQD